MQEDSGNRRESKEMEVNYSMKGGNRGNKIFWGVLFLLGAVAFLVNRLGFFGEIEGISFWSILFTIGLAAILISSLVKGSWGGILFSLAFIVIVNDELLGLEEITPWPVLGAAFLGTIGLNLLFPKFRRVKSYKIMAGGRHVMGDTISGDKVFYENAFGSAVKYVAGEIAQVNLDNAFGSMEVYFSDAVLKNHTAYVNVDSAFGKVTLYIPRGWRVVSNAATAFAGGIENNAEEGMGNPSSAEDILYLSGDVAFGVLDVQYI